MSEASAGDGEIAAATNYRNGQDNITPFGLDIHNLVFVISGLSIVAFVIVTLMFQEAATEFFGWLRSALTSTFDWFLLLSGNIFVVFCLLLIFTRLGSVRLGGPKAEPEYSYVGWFAMLFAACLHEGECEWIGTSWFQLISPTRTNWTKY